MSTTEPQSRPSVGGPQEKLEEEQANLETEVCHPVRAAQVVNELVEQSGGPFEDARVVAVRVGYDGHRVRNIVAGSPRKTG